jgi:ketosteroid isomerase-like protein
MSGANVEIVKALLAAYGRRDIPAMLALMGPDVELHEWPESPDARTYRGHDGMVRAIEAWEEVWERIDFEPAELIDLGDRVFMAVLNRMRGRGSSVEVSADAFHVYTLRDGKVVGMEFFMDRERARRAAGLESQEERQPKSEARR